jgi:thioesterase domain-containing protein
VALEMASQLHAMGEHVALLALFDPSCPHRRIYGSRRIEQLAAVMSSMPTLSGKSRFLMKKTKNIFKNKIVSRLQRLASKYYIKMGKPLPPKLNVAHLFAMSERATMAYDYSVYPGRITLFVPEYRYSPQDLQNAALLGWRDIAAGGVSLNIVRGAINHIDIVTNPYVKDLANKLNACLREAQKSLEPSDNFEYAQNLSCNL